MNTVEIIRKKRNKQKLSEEEISFLIKSVTAGKIPNYQFSAFLMAGYLNGFDNEETAALTYEMLHSGKVLDLSAIEGVKVDKHSTGGVGDKISLILAPIAAAAGVNVPMISGRGLGHTGGTLDKLESIPGFRTDLTLKKFRSVLKKHRTSLIGQTKEIAPADKIIYALRDITATVESIPLITASIMSKKLAEGTDALVFDVKTGSGAFMRSMKDSKKLAQSLIETSKAFDKKAMAFITDMNQPLGNYIGNWLEVYESIKVLRGEKVDDLLKVSLKLSGAMILLAGKASSLEEGIEVSQEMIDSGKAFDKFLNVAKAHGGDITYLKNPKKYPRSKYHTEVISEKEGFIKEIDNYRLGVCATELGAGRITMEDQIDPKAGIIFHKKIGDKISKGELIADLFSDKKNVIKFVAEKVNGAVTISDHKVKKKKLIYEIIQ
jgi:pyrimidine-nucleoside phosphorylase